MSSQATTSLLVVGAIFIAGNSYSASHAVSAIHFSAFAVLLYREVLPLMFSHSPLDAPSSKDNRLRISIGILAWTSFLAPLSLPRFVIYSDPEVKSAPTFSA